MDPNQNKEKTQENDNGNFNENQVGEDTNQSNQGNMYNQGNQGSYNNYSSGYQGKYQRGGYYQGGRGGYKQNNNNDYYNGGYSNYRGGYKKDYYKNYDNSQNNNKKNKPNNRINQLTEQETVDPYTAQMLVYRAEMYIFNKYPYLIDMNQKNEGLSKKITESSKFYIIKSFSDEDVHKAIKYNVWSSTKSGNQTLNQTYSKCLEDQGDVYLLFSTNGSGRFVGLAKMKSPVDFEKMFIYWTQDGKWGGMMNIEWCFIKDVPFKEFRDIKILMRDGLVKPISNSRDTQEVPCAEAIKVIEVFETYQNTNTILEHFEYYDMRQENYEKSNLSHS